MHCVSNCMNDMLKAQKLAAPTISPWQMLANAIVEQAVTDFRKAQARVRAHPENADRAKAEIAELEVFFRSQWFEMLTDVDGRLVLSRLRKEAA